MVDRFLTRGWAIQPEDPALTNWAHAARAQALQAVADPEMRAKWLVCDGTWFVGVDALNNDASGQVDGVALPHRTLALARRLYCDQGLHPGQVSVVYPGYPRPRDGESDAGFRYRVRRDAAHVDGLHGVGTPKRRFLAERHAWILGIPLTTTRAAPFVVWEGSHHVMARALGNALDAVAPKDWGQVDLTDVYTAARAECFETCARIEVSVPVGQSYLVHRLALHGVAPWGDHTAPPEGRMVAYFRPELPPGDGWLALP